MNTSDIKQLQNVCMAIGELKSQQTEMLPHNGHQSLYFENDEITTGLVNNKTEIKIHLLTGQLLYFHNEVGHFIDLTKDNIYEKLSNITKKYNLLMPEIKLDNVSHGQLSEFYSYAIKAKRTIELFRMTLDGNFTLVHLWPHRRDFSVELLSRKIEEQNNTKLSSGDEQYTDP